MARGSIGGKLEESLVFGGEFALAFLVALGAFRGFWGLYAVLGPYGLYWFVCLAGFTFWLMASLGELCLLCINYLCCLLPLIGGVFTKLIHYKENPRKALDSSLLPLQVHLQLKFLIKAKV